MQRTNESKQFKLFNLTAHLTAALGYVPQKLIPISKTLQTGRTRPNEQVQFVQWEEVGRSKLIEFVEFTK